MTDLHNQNESVGNSPDQNESGSMSQDVNVAPGTEGDAQRAANEAAGIISGSVAEQAEETSDRVSRQVEAVKSVVTKPLPSAPKMSGSEATAEELLKRLRWGEPALTIIDARSRRDFNAERITGAMSRDQVSEATDSSLEFQRDIYVYGEGEGEATDVINQLRQAGYQKVAHLQGGLAAWKAVGGATEGVEAFSSPPGARV